MIYIFLLIFFSINVLPHHAQELNFVKNQIVIQDVVGNIETRYLNSHVWTPVTAGITIPQNSFIRLNSPDSTIHIAYPDGSTVRLIGIGVFFFENISEVINNAYQSKILVLFGRWVYQSHPDYHSRFIVNTDITTSVVENGVGAGFFYNGTSEFVLKKGRGIISYRQQDAKAIVLDEQQYVKFNILEGFFFPKLATEELFKQYLIFSEEKTTNNKTNTKDLEYLSLLSSMKSSEFALNNTPQEILTNKDITIQQINILKNLNFKKRSDFLQVTIPKIPKAPEPVPIISPIYTPSIPQNLLAEIDVKDFKITKEDIVKIEDIPIPNRILIPGRVRSTIPRRAIPKIIDPREEYEYEYEYEETLAELTEDILAEEAEIRYDANDEYLNRNLDSDAYKLDKFDAQELDSILNSEFSSIFY